MSLQNFEENIKRREDRLQKIIKKVAERYTQAVYLPIRTQYLSLKMGDQVQKAKMSKVSKVMQALRDDFASLLLSLESIIDSILTDLRETWFEMLLRKMRLILRELQSLQYQNSVPKLAEKLTESIYAELVRNIRQCSQEFQKHLKESQARNESEVTVENFSRKP